MVPESGADAPSVLSAVYPDSTPAKNRQADVPQYGRSMIEMLGVLAIIGVLSVGGIAGYSKAMMKYRINKTIEQISIISQNITTYYSFQKDFSGINCYPEFSGDDKDTGCPIMKKAKLIPDEMLELSDGKISKITNAFGGKIAINIHENLHQKGFNLEFHNIPSEACIDLATQDWNRITSSGLVQIMIQREDNMIGYASNAMDCTHNPEGSYDPDSAAGDTLIACVNGSDVSIPIDIDKAVGGCNCNGKDCIISLTFKK